MAAFTEELLSEKLQRLLPTQVSIQTTSHWILYHRKRYAKQSVQVWEREILKAPPEKRVTFLYLANDVMQTSRAKGPEFIQEFSKVLVPVVQKVYSEGDHEAQKQIERLLLVWQDRKVISQSLIDQMRAGFNRMPSRAAAPERPPHEDLARQLSSVAERNRRIEDLAEAMKTMKPELRSGEALHNAPPETYASVHSATRDVLHTMESYVKLLEEDLPAREALVTSLQQQLAALEKSTAERRAQLLDAQANMSPVITALRTALLQPPPSELPKIDPPAAAAAAVAAAAAHEAYTPLPAPHAATSGSFTTTTPTTAAAAAAAPEAAPEPAPAIPPSLLAVLAQLGPQATQLFSAVQGSSSGPTDGPQ